MLIFLYLTALLLYLADAITLNNGRYENVYIVIQDSIDENLELLDRIQNVFTDASKLLFTATKNHVYFGKIKILIPKSWSSQPYYKQLPALSTLDTCINVETSRISPPHVRSKTYQCGEEGFAMQLQPSFLLQTGLTRWGKHENVIVHEWGHLRWGLFDEYPDSFAESPKFYQYAGEWKPVRCSQKIQGSVGQDSISSTRLAETYCNTKNSSKKMRETCYFYPYMEQKEDVTASLMGFQYIDQLTMFCDKDDESVSENQRHNSIAPNAQNKFCNGKSAWEVMREHDDFINNHELSSDTNTSPEFEFIQETEIYRVFVLDISGSMTTKNRIGILRQAGEYIIQDIIAESSWLGIVEFSTTAYVREDLMQVNSQADRISLINALPTGTSGSTCIGCGINLAISVLTDLFDSPENGEIYLISDGQNNYGDIHSARSKAIHAKVKITTIAVSQQADTLLSDIALETGGKHFTYLENGNFSFAAVFKEAVSTGGCITSAASQPETILSEKTAANVLQTSFSIETGLGKNTSVTVLTTIDDTIHLQLNGPTNFTTNLTVSGNRATIKIDGNAKIGEYRLTITTSVSGQIIEYHVTSSPTVTTNDVIRIVSRLSKSNVDLSNGDLPILFADVTKSYAPVINVTVIATVESSSNLPCSLHLFDNGADPDRQKNDGTYCCYILPECLGSGRVQIKVKAAGQAGETFLLYKTIGSAPQYAEDEVTKEPIPDSFQRNVVTEELYVTNYIYDESLDSVAPGRITDVEINNIETETTQNGENRNYTITWTATGDDKNQGQASSYEMRISNDIGTLRDNFESADLFNMTNSTIQPQIVGTTEALKLIVNAEQSYVETTFFAVRAVDDSGNKGPVSNVISIVVATGFRLSGEQGYAVDDDFVFDDVDEPQTQSNDKFNARAIIIGVTVTSGILLFGAIAVFFVKKSKTQKAAVADSHVSLFSRDSSVTEVTHHQSYNRERVFASTSLPHRLPLHAFGISSPEIPSIKSKAGQLKHKNFQGINTSQTTIASSRFGQKNDDTYNDKIVNEIAVVDIENELQQNNGNIQSRQMEAYGNHNAKLKENVNKDNVIDIEEGITEFEDPDDYITQTCKDTFPVINIPFHMTNKCTRDHEQILEEFFNKPQDLKIVDSTEKHKILENLPALPFTTDENVDHSHPPPNMAMHILNPSDYGTGKKPYVFPSPFSGVKDTFCTSKQTTFDEIHSEDNPNDADAHSNKDEGRDESGSQLSMVYSNDSTDEFENQIFGNADEVGAVLKDDNSLFDEVVETDVLESSLIDPDVDIINNETISDNTYHKLQSNAMTADISKTESSESEYVVSNDDGPKFDRQCYENPAYAKNVETMK